LLQLCTKHTSSERISLISPLLYPCMTTADWVSCVHSAVVVNGTHCPKEALWSHFWCIHWANQTQILGLKTATHDYIRHDHTSLVY
jgi:hypothetical protein